MKCSFHFKFKAIVKWKVKENKKKTEYAVFISIQILWVIGQKTTAKKKITDFLKNRVASLFTCFEKVLTICRV